MRSIVRFGLLTATLVSAFAVLTLVSSAEWLSEPQSGAAADWPLFLNGEAVGSTTNSTVLKTRLGSFKSKLDMNVSANAAMPTIGSIALVPDERISMADLGQIWDALEDYFDFPPFERVLLSRGASCKSGPGESLMPRFVLSNEKLSNEALARIRNGGSCLQSIDIIVYGPKDGMNGASMKSYRVSNSGIEIDDSGKYFLNERVGSGPNRVSASSNIAHPTLRRRLAAASVKQRPIAPDTLEKEFGILVERRKKEGSDDFFWGDEGIVVPVIVNGKTPYSSFARILLVAADADIKLKIIVNNTGML